jgi:hypothetical protein
MTLCLGGRGLDDVDVDALTQTLRRQPRQPGAAAATRRLELHGNAIGDAGAESLAEMLICNTELQELILSDNRGIGSDGAAALLRALTFNRTLTKLHLPLGIPAPLRRKIGSSIMRNRALEQIRRGANSLNCRGHLGSSAGLGPDDAMLLADALLKLPRQVAKMDLSFNLIGDSGAIAIAGVLSSTTSPCLVRTINLSRNNISSDGAVALSLQLHANAHVSALDLRENAIDDRGLNALADALRRNRTLTCLRLSKNNAFTLSGIECFAASLCENPCIVTLDLRCNNQQVRGGVQVALQNRAETFSRIDACNAMISEVLRRNDRIKRRRQLRFPFSNPAFVSTILLGSMRPPTHLARLNSQGPHFAAFLKRIIADYVGVAYRFAVHEWLDAQCGVSQ